MRSSGRHGGETKKTKSRELGVACRCAAGAITRVGVLVFSRGFPIVVRSSTWTVSRRMVTNAIAAQSACLA